MNTSLQLEPEALAFLETAAQRPFLFELGPEQGRDGFNQIQGGPVYKPAVEIEDLSIAGGPSGQVSIRILRPQSAPPDLPVIFYIHGGGWVSGNRHTHDRLTRELAARTGAAVVFPEYSLSPEAKYPIAIEESYAVLKWIADRGREVGLEPDRVVVAGDGVGGNMAAVISIMSKERGGPPILGQLLFYPVTEANFDTDSYQQFAEGYHLRRDAMMWFWNQYTTNPRERNDILASPLRASERQLKGLPCALVITAEADVLRDEGEAYANKLRKAGVRVTGARFNGTIHDFLMLNYLANTAAARGAMMLATTWLREKLKVN